MGILDRVSDAGERSTGCLERSAMEACPVKSTSLPLDEAAEAKEYHDEVAHFFIFSLHPGRKR